jgi:hypothetical protein
LSFIKIGSATVMLYIAARINLYLYFLYFVIDLGGISIGL